jgi:glycosyltransferase involved in cell wall biosynthesis
MDNDIVVGHVGRFQYQKNHELLIDIYNSFHKKYSDSRLLLVGQGVEEAAIKDKVNKLKLEENVMFLGIRSDVNEIMQAMDVFVLPSRFEGLGIVLIEAQAAGLPCVTSKNVVPDIEMLLEMLNL